MISTVGPETFRFMIDAKSLIIGFLVDTKPDEGNRNRLQLAMTVMKMSDLFRWHDECRLRVYVNVEILKKPLNTPEIAYKTHCLPTCMFHMDSTESSRLVCCKVKCFALTDSMRHVVVVEI
ncbi:CLUMA_CG018534, isoform A [Clunio marinus]|uniref:CLUMA_CG018534, isoform A n=1 Tax=Clunio marinus TaxID=568069 RepID=A0A1J1IY50_9DIPT|nr:CLUMA_CG018534, isoform A [Clunio marinus]